MEDISVVIVEYHSVEQLGRALDALRPAMEGLSWNLLIVSNSEYDPWTRLILQQRVPGARWIFNDRNVGFARAVNAAITRSSSAFVMLLNPDARVLGGRVADLLEYFYDHPDVAAAGPRVVGEDGRPQDSARRFLSPAAAVLRSLRRIAAVSGGAVVEHEHTARAVEVDWVSGACLVVRRSAIETVGLLDPYYFMYVEDMDWCKRFWDSGYRVAHWPALTIEHNGARLSARGLVDRRAQRFTWMHLKNCCHFWARHGLHPRRPSPSAPLLVTALKRS